LTFKAFLIKNAADLSTNFPVNRFLAILEIVMKTTSSVFQAHTGSKYQAKQWVCQLPAHTPQSHLYTAKTLRQKLHNWGTLEWVILTSNNNTFMDLEIQIQNSNTTTKSYQKV
jgi:hypothetical protein